MHIAHHVPLLLAPGTWSQDVSAAVMHEVWSIGDGRHIPLVENGGPQGAEGAEGHREHNSKHTRGM